MSANADPLDICRTDAFKIRKRLLSLLPDAPQGIDLGRGDPCDPPSWRADAVISLFSVFTDHALRYAAERLTLPSDLSIQELELLWEQVIAQVDATTRA